MNHVVTNMAHSARERLKNMARAGGRDADYLFQRYAFERFFYRIGESPYANRFILKGASLFTLWLGPMFRVTQDTDLESSLTPDHGRMAAVFREIAETPVACDDGVVFDLSSLSVEDIKKQDDYKGLRVKFHARMGQARLPLQFDIGFGDSVYPRAEIAEYPVLLGGPKPRIKVYPQYTVVAEKFSAAVELGMANSRLKDYFDLWALSGNFAFDLGILKTAIQRTFARNGLAVPSDWPIGLRDEFADDAMKISQWNAFLRKTRPQMRPDALADAVARIRDFLAPVVSGENRPHLVWSPETKQWEAIPPLSM